MKRHSSWRRIWIIVLSMAVLSGLSPSLLRAQTNMDELLLQIQDGARSSAQLNADRERRFLADKNAQAKELARVEAERNEAKKRADAAKAKFARGQAEIAALKEQLKQQVGESAEIYSAIAEAAGDLRQQASTSWVSAQFPERIAMLDELSRASELPDISDIELLWFMYAQEAAESGRVRAFDANVISAQGDTSAAKVTRIGAFNAFTDKGYLRLEPDSKELAIIARQPDVAKRHASAFFEQDSDIRTALIDPSLGDLLQLISQRPTLMDRVHQGGEVGYVIIAIGIFGAVLAIYQLVYLMGVGARVRRQLADVSQANQNNPLGRVLSSLSDNPHEQDPEVLETRLSEAVLRETPKLERFQSLLRMIVAAGPLLGLLGTVVGMIITFQVITEVGAGDPRLMAGGISRAMIATVLGLGIAIPLLFANSFLMARSRVLTQILDEQAAGLLAQKLESRKA